MSGGVAQLILAAGLWWHDKPPAEGNTFAPVHGAESPRSIEAKAADVRKVLIEVGLWLEQPEHAPALARFLRTEARAPVHRHIETVT